MIDYLKSRRGKQRNKWRSSSELFTSFDRTLGVEKILKTLSTHCPKTYPPNKNLVWREQIQRQQYDNVHHEVKIHNHNITAYSAA